MVVFIEHDFWECRVGWSQFCFAAPVVEGFDGESITNLRNYDLPVLVADSPIHYQQLHNQRGVSENGK